MARKHTASGVQRDHVDRRSRLNALRVLVADRDRRTALLVKRILFTLGFREMDIAVSGQEALKHLASYPYDMIITEWNMAPIDGLTLVKAIRTAQSDARIRRDIPIIMLTARADRDSVRIARDAGITEFVAKPFSANTISNRMIQIIDNPRAFVVAPPIFVGPDRRRRGRPPFGVEERRGREKPPALPPNTSLQTKLGGMSAADIIGELEVSEAQAVLMKAEGEFIDWARADIALLRKAFASLKRSPKDVVVKERLADAAYAIKAQAGIFGYDLGTQVAGLLLNYIAERADFTPDHIVVIGKHIDTIEIIFKEKIKESGQGLAADMLRSLQKLIEKMG